MSIYDQVGTGGYKARFVQTNKDLDIRNFDRSDAYGEYKVTREGIEFLDSFPIHIFSTKSDSEKKYVCHPDYELQKGDIIEYTDDGFKYLVHEKDVHSTIQAFGKMKRAEQSISFKDSNNEVHELFYHITNTGMGSQDSNHAVPFSDTKKQLWVQVNPSSNKIFKNQRFILNHLEPYKITAYDNFTITGVFKLTLEATQEVAGDDFITNIAFNDMDNTNIPDTGKNGIFFTKDSLRIAIEDSQSVEVYNYINDVIDPFTLFDFRIDNISASEYTIVSETDNSIEIKSDGYYFAGELVAIDQSTLLEYTIPIELVSALG
jgi:hypothetical protein